MGFSSSSRTAASPFQSGIGNLGTESVIDVHRAGAEVLGVPWEKCDVVWGRLLPSNLPFTCVSGGSQTTHAMTRAAYAVAMDAQAETPGNAATEPGRQDLRITRSRTGASFLRVLGARGLDRGMTFAQAAQRAIELGGKYDENKVASRCPQSDQGVGGCAGGSGPGGGREG